MADGAAIRVPRDINRVGGPRADRVAEIAIGVLALLSPLAFDVVEHIYVAIADAVPDSRVLLTAVRFVLAIAT